MKTTTQTETACTHAPFGPQSKTDAVLVTTFKTKLFKWEWVAQPDAAKEDRIEARDFWRQAFGEQDVVWRRRDEQIVSKWGVETDTHFEPNDPSLREKAYALCRERKQNAWTYLCAIMQNAERGEVEHARRNGTKPTNPL